MAARGGPTRRAIIWAREMVSQPALLAAALTIAGMALRFHRLGEWSLWIEEHHTLRHSTAISSLGSAFATTRPLYYLLTRLLLFFGEPTEWLLRLPSAVIGGLSIPLIFVLFKRIVNLRVALIATALLAISPWHIYWSQNARFYSLALVFYSLSLSLFYIGVQRQKRLWTAAAMGLFALGLATHPLVVFVVPVIIAYALGLLAFHQQQASRFLWQSVAAMAAVPVAAYLLYEAYSVFLLGQTPVAVRYFRNFFSPETRTFIGYLSPYVMLTSVVYYVGTPLSVMSVIGAGSLLKQRSKEGMFLALGAYLPFVAMIGLTLVSSTANRYVFMTLPFWIVLGALGIEALVSRASVVRALLAFGMLVFVVPVDPVIEDAVHHFNAEFAIALGVLILVSIGASCLVWKSLSKDQGSYDQGLGLVIVVIGGLLIAHPLVADYMYFVFQHGHRDNWARAVAVVENSVHQDDQVVSHIHPLVDYYLGPDATIIGLDDPNLPDQLRDGGRFWVISDFSYEITGSPFVPYLESSCQEVRRFESFTAGRPWPLIVSLCTIPESGGNQSSYEISGRQGTDLHLVDVNSDERSAAGAAERKKGETATPGRTRQA